MRHGSPADTAAPPAVPATRSRPRPDEDAAGWTPAVFAAVGVVLLVVSALPLVAGGPAGSRSASTSAAGTAPTPAPAPSQSVPAASRTSAGNAAGPLGKTAATSVDALQRQVVRRGGFYELRTRCHFVRTDVDARFAAELGHFLDRMQNVFEHLFPGECRVEVTPEVVVFADVEDYRTTSRDASRGMFRWEYQTKAGRRQMTEFTLYSYTAAAEQRRFARFPQFLLLHEGTHMLIQTRAGFHAVPAWFQEGCAMFVEQWDLDSPADRNVARIIARRRSVPAMLESRRQGTLPPLRELSKLERLDVDGFGRKTNLRYQQAEAFFTFLMTTRDRRKLLRKAYDELIEGRSADAVLFDGEAGAKLEAEWLLWLRKPE